MIPEHHRQSGVTSYYDTEQGWTDMWDCWEQDDFVLDATRVTLAVGGTGWDGDTFKNRYLDGQIRHPDQQDVAQYGVCS